MNYNHSSNLDFEDTYTIGGFSLGSEKESFDAIFENTYDAMNAKTVDIMRDVSEIIAEPHKMAVYKEAMLEDLKDFSEKLQMESYDPSKPEAANYHGGVLGSMYDQVSQIWDNCADDLIKESTRVGNLLPIKAVDFPVLVRQHVALAGNVIMQTEVTPTPIIKKHIEQRWVYDQTDPTKRWEWPQCLFDKDATEAIFDAGKGVKLKADPVALPLYNYSIVEDLMGISDPTFSQSIGINLRVSKAVLADGTEIPMPNMRISLSDNTWLGGDINYTKADGTVVTDSIIGTANFRTNQVTLLAANDEVKQVVFEGYLSNERNERHVRWEYERMEREWHIEDGCSTDMPYSLEQLQESKALMNLDLYKKTQADIAEFLVQMEDSKILSFLDDAYDTYKGATLDPMGYNPYVQETTFDCDSQQQTVALLSEYIDRMLKWQIDRFLMKIADDAKLDNLTFVIYGNPRYISLLGKNVSWISRAGATRAGGIKLDFSYGVMTAGDVTVQVVASKKIDANRIQGLRLIPFPLSKEQYTWKHYKYTTHIVTSTNSAYKAPDLPGGSMTYLMGKSRYVDTMIQGIQGHIFFDNAGLVGFN